MRPLPLVLLLVAVALHAGSLPFARDGLIDTPTATVLEHTELMFGTCFTMFSYSNPDGSTEDDFALAGHLDCGLFGWAQAGLCYLGEAGLSAHLRLLPLSETYARPGIAIGVQNITTEEDYEFFRGGPEDRLYSNGRNQTFSAYLVLTKNVGYLTGQPVSVSLGYGIGRFWEDEQEDPEAATNPATGLFGSMSWSFGPAEAYLEYDSRDLNLGAQYQFGDHVRVQAAVAEIEELMASSSEDYDSTDVMRHVKFTVGLEFVLGPLYRPRSGGFERTEEQLRTLEQIEQYRREIEETMRDLEERLRD
ncbi:hypothetical protein JW921_00740 [Candidatus Fermentibacterales bacterium]|nr:hypothetical protein [Candidatus Fermentibacterales bacterium]